MIHIQYRSPRLSLFGQIKIMGFMFLCMLLVSIHIVANVAAFKFIANTFDIPMFEVIGFIMVGLVVAGVMVHDGRVDKQNIKSTRPDGSVRSSVTLVEWLGLGCFVAFILITLAVIGLLGYTYIR